MWNFDVILVLNPYLAISFCCYLTPFNLGDIVRIGVKGWFGGAFLLFQQNLVTNINWFRLSFMLFVKQHFLYVAASCCCDEYACLSIPSYVRLGGTEGVWFVFFFQTVPLLVIFPVQYGEQPCTAKGSCEALSWDLFL